MTSNRIAQSRKVMTKAEVEAALEKIGAGDRIGECHT